jgi:hypothetical protein
MDSPISLFRKSFFYAFIIAGIAGIALRIIPFTLMMNSFSDPIDAFLGMQPYLALWILSNLYSILLTTLFALVAPWLMVSFFSEWFYTRSLNRRSLFKILWDEYLKWVSVMTLLLLIVVNINNSFHYSSGSNIYIPTSIFLVSLTVYLVFIISGNSKILIKTILYGIPVFLFSAIFGSYNYNGFELGQKLSWVFWTVYLVICYLNVFHYDDDIDLNVPGRADDENRSISNLWIFSKEFGNQNISLVNTSSNLKKFFYSFKLLTSQNKAIYMQLFLVMSAITLFFAISYSFGSFYGDISKNNIASTIAIPILVLLISGIIFAVISPKFLLLQKEEFLFTRPVNRGKLYIDNYLVQGTFILLISLLICFIIFNSQAYPYFQEINMIPVILTLLWIYLTGEAGIFLIFSLFIYDYTLLFFDNNSWSNLSFSFFCNLQSNGIYSMCLWAGALFFRLWDFQWFLNKEIGLFNGISAMVKNLAKLYFPPIALLFVITLGTTVLNPLTKFLNTYNLEKSDFPENNTDIMKAVFFQGDSKRSKAFQMLLSNPKDKNAYLLMAEFYLEEVYKATLYYNKLYYYKLFINAPWGYTFSPARANYWLELSKELKDSPEYIYNTSIFHLLNDDYALAVKEAEKAALISNKPEYYQYLAEIYEKQFYNEKAIMSYQKAITLSKDKKGELLLKIGNIYWNNRFYNRAIDYYAQAVNQDNKTALPGKAYYYYGLCPKFEEINKTNISNNLLNDIQFTLSICQGNKYVQYFHKRHGDTRNIIPYSERMKYDEFPTAPYDRKLGYQYDYESSSPGFSLDYAKFYLEHNDFESALKKFQMVNNYYGRHKGDTALLQLKMGKLPDAFETIKAAENSQKYKTGVNYLEVNRTNYDSNIYLAKLKLENEKPTLETAQKFLLSAPDTETAFAELKKIFKGLELKDLEKLKNEYNRFYRGFEMSGMAFISNNKNVERSRVLLAKTKDSEFKQIKQIITTF